MNNRSFRGFFCLMALLGWGAAANAAAPAADTPPQATETASPAAPQPAPADARLSNAQLEQLVAPIALYPDVLIAQILPAATNPLDVVEASRWLKEQRDSGEIDAKDWDPSVKALVHYPQVLDMLNDKLEWMRQLGQAVAEQENGVLDAIQRMRSKAEEAGVLESNAQQAVRTEGPTIIIEPAQPEVIYVPQYEPPVFYAGGYWDWGYPRLSFGYPYSVGPWLDLDCNWIDRGICFGGFGFRHGFFTEDRFFRDGRYYGRGDRLFSRSDYGRSGDFFGRWRPEPSRMRSSFSGHGSLASSGGLHGLRGPVSAINSQAITRGLQARSGVGDGSRSGDRRSQAQIPGLTARSGVGDGSRSGDRRSQAQIPGLTARSGVGDGSRSGDRRSQAQIPGLSARAGVGDGGRSGDRRSQASGPSFSTATGIRSQGSLPGGSGRTPQLNTRTFSSNGLHASPAIRSGGMALSPGGGSATIRSGGVRSIQGGGGSSYSGGIRSSGGSGIRGSFGGGGTSGSGGSGIRGSFGGGGTRSSGGGGGGIHGGGGGGRSGGGAADATDASRGSSLVFSGNITRGSWVYGSIREYASPMDEAAGQVPGVFVIEIRGA